MIRKCLAWVRDITQQVLGPASNDVKPLQIEACWLEDRLLYSATALPIDLDGGSVTAEVTQEEIDSLLALVDAQLTTDAPAAADILNATDSLDASTAAVTDVVTNVLTDVVTASDISSSQQHHVAFIDAGLDNLDQLLGQLQATYDSENQSFEVVLIDNRFSGIEQISTFLSGASHQFSSIHLITHGDAGAFQLGSDLVDLNSLADHSQQLAMWQHSLTADADLMIYGCQVASTLDGQELGNELAALLNVDVAMSSTTTGSSLLGGDWTLEYQVGQIDYAIDFGSTEIDQWHHALDLTAVGSEVLVNGSTASTQQMTQETGGNIGMDSSGRYAISWQDNRSGNNDVYARIYNADGSARTAEFMVHATNSAAQDWNSIAMADNGNIVVTWSDNRSGTYEVYMRMFNVDGTALTGETLVSTRTGSQDYHAVDFGGDGSFVVVFEDATGTDIYFQRFDSSGNAVGSNTIANSTTSNAQNRADVAVRQDGSFVVTWTSASQDFGTSLGVYARIFNSSGTALSSEILVNGTTSGDQTYSSIDADSSGNFNVTWQSTDASGTGVFARRFNSSGTALAAEFQVNTYTAGSQTYPHMAMNSSGDFIVTWNEENGKDGGGTGTYAQQFDSAGTRIGGEVLINSTTAGTQRFGSAGYVGSSAAFAWQGAGTGDSSGIFMRRFTTTNFSTLTVNTTSDVSDGTTTSIAALLDNRGADGVISLREAIAAANNSANGTGGVDRINFNIGSGLQTITIGTTQLPTITSAMLIDGWTQTGFTSSPLIELNGGNTGTNKDGFFISGGTGTTIRGFIINRFTGNGIDIASANDVTIEGNWIGLSNTGTAASANSLRGIYALNSTGLMIGGTSTNSRNVISGNTQQGVYFDNVDNSYVYGNYIGTNVSGNGDVSGTTANTAQSGMVMLNGSSGNQVGNTALSGARNVFSGNNHYGLEIQGSTSTSNTVVGNFLGTDSTGTSSVGNSNGGFAFWGSGTGNLLGGNVISGNLGIGVLVGSGASGATIQGNYIGLAVDGSSWLGNATSGVYVAGSSINTLIGTNADGSNDTAEANTISGNVDGIIITDAGTTGTIVAGNFIGTDASGNLARGNSGDGVRIIAGATSNTIGGSSSARRNIISANGGDGIQIDGEASDSNTIQNNYIGVNASANSLLGNGGFGIYVSNGADSTVIGGLNLGNVIGGNYLGGISIDGASTSTFIMGNFIGTNSSGTVDLGNLQHGIYLANSASNTTIGSTTANTGNVIAFNGEGSGSFAGIYVASSASTGNMFIANSIYNNSGLGIDLGTIGITANDNLDGDTGPNNLQNTPVLSTATTDGATVTVSGSLNSVASVTGMIIHFYATPSAGNVNARQGRRYLGSTTVNTNASGNATFTNVALSSAVTAGEVITATTTSSSTNGNTSEFSQGIVATVSTGNSTPTAQQLISTNGGGIELNNDGGNNAYLISSSGLSTALSAYTVEIKFAGNNTGGDTALFSYNTTAGDVISIQLSGNDLMMDASTAGTVVTSGTNYRSLLFDGQVHTLSATWNSTNGSWAFYVDGVLRNSGTGIATGSSIAAGGTFVFGQEQDTQGGGFDVTQRFSGTLYDARLFNTVRTASQILATYNSDVPRLESGLVSNWRFDDLSAAGVTTGAVSGNNLTVGRVTGSGFTNSNPTLTLQLNENTTTGTTVGTVLGTDIEREARIAALLSADDTLRYSAETGKFYKVVTTNTDWTVARTNAIATTLGGIAGQLVTVRSAAENAFLQALAQAANKEMWLSGNDITTEGTWRWQSAGADIDQFWQGTAAGYATNGAYTNWAAGEPNDNGGTGDYQVMYTNGQWDDEANNGSAVPNGYFVEWNADAVLDATNALTYSITSQTVNGAFSINSSTGVITVANGTLLNFENNTSHTLSVRVTDGSGASFDRTYTIALNDLAEDTNSPTDLSSGINLNNDGGNTAYLRTTNGGAIFGGQTALTLETSFAIGTNNSNTNTLVSYYTSTGSDEVQLRVLPTGAIHFGINGTVINSPVVSQLIDGKMHSVAVSWDNTNGDVRYFVDGQLVGTATGLKTGYTLQGSGTLVLGQDQDTLDGTYDPAQCFKGTLYDLRVWNNAISDEQISNNYQQVAGFNESGLVANWRMSGLSGGNTVVDSVGGVNLTVANVAAGGGWISSTTTSGLTVNENASAGTRVGQLIATEIDFARDIVLDGLFREAANPGTITTYTAGQTIGNWTVQSGSVELAGTTFQSSPLGGRSVDLNGSAAGAISQVLTTTAGRQYQVVFNASGNWLSGEATKDFRVSAGGTSQTYSLAQPTGWSSSNVLFSGRSMTFTATGNSTTLAFQSLDGGDSGALIADVRVIEIPTAVQTLLSNDTTLSYDAATGKFYKAVASNQTFANAQSAAIATTLNGVAGQMVTIGSQYENDVVWNLARGLNSNIWIGAADSGVEGTWRWFNGSTAGNTFWVGTSTGTLQANQYANWSTGEPNDFGGNEDFGTLDLTTGRWNDASGTNVPRQYIVEWDASEVLSNFRYTIISDPSGAFAINANTGEITVGNATPLNEIATDPSITVQVTDASGNSYNESFTIAVNRVNDNAPIITSNGAGASATINVSENQTTVTTVVATDADLPVQTLAYSIIGGADASRFTINSSTGAVTFISAPNFESPLDVGGDNVYDLVVRASDGSLFDDQTIAVTVTNVNEAPTNIYSVSNVSDTNVAGYYSFSSVNNLGRDDSGDTQPITFTGTPGTVSGPVSGSALDLTGTQFGNIASMTTGGAMTIASWVRFNATGTWERVIDLGQANSGGIGNIYIARLGNTSDLTFTIEKGGTYTYRATAAAAITNGTWMHVAGTVDASGNMTLYVNGTAVATATGVAPDVGVRTNHFIGKSNWAADSAFVGSIDDLLIVNGAMSATNIAQLYQQTTAFSIAENSANGTLIGTALTSDPDAANTYTYSLTNNAGGRFAINATTGVITVANSSLLNFEANTSHTIVVQSMDQGGLSTNKTFTITVTDVNEAPTAAADSATALEAGGVSNGTAGTNPTGNVLTNDTDVDAGDTKTVSGVAAGVVGSASTNVGSSVTGTYGSISIAANGSYTYTVDNNNAAVQALRTTANTLADVFTYTMRDAAGLTSTTQITVTIQGANDAPTAVADTATAVEAGGVSNGTAGTNPTGNVLTNDTDPDSSANGETKAVSGVAAGVVGSASTNVGSSVSGTYGAIVIAADGTYTYTVDNNNAAVQALRTSGNTLQDVFTYTMRDAVGLTSTTQITVTIQGANDAPNDIALVGNSGTNLVTNGSFETNNGAANTFTAGAAVTVSGWTAIGGEGFEVWNNFTNGGPAAASNGNTTLELDVGNGLNGISQNITTAAGQKYVLSFDFSGRTGQRALPSKSIGRIN